MATNLPSNLYTGGAVVFNSTPYTQFYLQSMQRKRAKDEALDNYFRDFNKSINPAGMRNQDIEGWMGKVNDWRGYYQQNKEAIKNPRLDNGRAYSEYVGRFQDINADTQRSKNLGEISKQYVVPLATNPDKRARLNDNGVNAIHAHDVSMYDQTHKELDPSALDFSAKPFDIGAQKKLDQIAMQGVKMSNMVQGKTVDPKTKTRIISYHAEYSPNDLKTVAGRYVDAYKNDSSFQEAIDSVIHDPNTYDKYNATFKKVYGRDITHNEDMAAAYGLSRVQSEVDTQKASGYSPYSPWDYLATREAYHDYTQGDQEEYNNVIHDRVSTLVNEAKSKMTNSMYASDLPSIPLDYATMQALKVNDLKLTNDGKIVGSWLDNNGNTHYNPPMTQEELEYALGRRDLSKKDYKKEFSPKKETPKKDTKKDPLGLF